jgi:ABC-type transport system substrate-binding protein
MLLLVCMTLSLFAGCKKENTASPPPGSSSSPAVGGDSPGGNDIASIEGLTPITTTADKSGSVQKSVVNVGVAADITDWYPWFLGNAGANASLWGIYQTLAENSDGLYYPCLAKSWEIAVDGMSLDVELYEGIYDTNGYPFTASDAKFSIETAMNTMGTEYTTIVEEFVIKDDTHFTYKLLHPLYLGDLRALLVVNMMTEKSFTESGEKLHTTPIGTGPYKLDKAVSGSKFTFIKNTDYWQKDESAINMRSMSNADTINFFVLPESAQRTTALKTGTIDVCGNISAADLSQFDGKNGTWIVGVPDNLSLTLLPNCNDTSPCKDLNLRLAISYAIDNQFILENEYNGKGTALTELAPSWVASFDDAWKTEDNYYKNDVEKAKEYLKKSSYTGEVLEILCQQDGHSENVAVLVGSFLDEIGVKYHINAIDSATFTSYILDPNQWDIQLRSFPSTAGYYGQTAFSILSKTRFTWGGSANFIFDDKLEELLNICMLESTSTPENNRKLHEYIIENCYLMGLVNPESQIVVPDWISAVGISPRKTFLPGGSIYTGA